MGKRNGKEMVFWKREGGEEGWMVEKEILKEILMKIQARD